MLRSPKLNGVMKILSSKQGVVQSTSTQCARDSSIVENVARYFVYFKGISVIFPLRMTPVKCLVARELRLACIMLLRLQLMIPGSIFTAASACAGRCTEAAVRQVGIVFNELCPSVDCMPSFAIIFLHGRGTGADVNTQRKNSYDRSRFVYA